MRTLPIFLLLLAACTTPAAQPTAPPAAKSAETFQVIPLQYSAAPELANTLQSLFARNPDVRVTCDMRTNSLIIVAGAEDLARMEDLVRRVDVQVKAKH